MGGGLGTGLSRVPGRRLRPVLTWGLLSLLGCGLFAGGLCLLSGAGTPREILDGCFPDRLSKLAGCAALFALLGLLGIGLGLLRAGGLRPFFRRVAGSRLHRGLTAALLGSLLAAVLGCTVLAGDPPPSPIVLSEVCCSNFTLKQTPDTGEYADYIELCNVSEATADLKGYYLSNRGKKRNLYRLPSVTLEPGACLLLWADGTGTSGVSENGVLHLNFSLAPGDTVYLSSPHGTLLDHVQLPERSKNLSMTLLDGSWIRAKGTPGQANETAEAIPAETLPAPEFSLPQGFYDGPLTLTLSAAPGCTIRYTLDGRVPDENAPVYDGPLTLTDLSSAPNRVVSQPNTTPDRSGAVTEPVDKGTVVRAAAFDGAGARSPTATAVYFVGRDTFAKYRGTAVLSVTADPNDLFGNYGICVTGLEYDRWLAAGGEGKAPWPSYNQKGRLAERDAELVLWDSSGRLLLESACGIRVQGNSSRARAVKRFSFFARPIYGTKNVFSASIFSGRLSHSFCTRDHPTDVMAQALTAPLGLGGLEAIPAVMFLNGEYYCTTYLRERYDSRYFSERYGVEDGDLILITDNELDQGTEADYEDYLDLLRYIGSHDCGDPAVYEAVCARMDVENYAAYVAANLYLNNTDWSVKKNYKLWRTRSADGGGVRDGRWRWLVYDMDGCYWTRKVFGDAPRASYNLFGYVQPYTGLPFAEMSPFAELLQNQAFKDLFCRIWLDLMNGSLSYARALPQLERFEMTDDAFWPEFLRDRPRYAPQILIDGLGLAGTPCALTIRVDAPEGGTVRVNTAAPAFSGGSWTGGYVTGVPLTLTAEPAPGWRFVGWSGAAGGTEAQLTLTPTGDTAVTARFEKN